MSRSDYKVTFKENFFSSYSYLCLHIIIYIGNISNVFYSSSITDFRFTGRGGFQNVFINFVRRGRINKALNDFNLPQDLINFMSL